MLQVFCKGACSLDLTDKNTDKPTGGPGNVTLKCFGIDWTFSKKT